MNELMKIFDRSNERQSFDQIKISIASPERIRSWSYGEVKKPETINYRTFKPERDGLFCARIFGPIKDYECLCGKYKRMKYHGVICEKCGVEVTLSKLRRERMGHIELASPVAHIWFLKSLPSRIGLLIDMSLKNLERVLYFENYIVTEPGLTSLKLHELLSEEQLQEVIDIYGEDNFSVGIGAEVIHSMLENIDLQAENDRLTIELCEKMSDIKRKRLVKRLNLIKAFMESDSHPEWMILKVIPVIPPELRPLIPLDGGRFATSDLNELYRRVINRNNRLKRLIELHAPNIIVRNEKRMLQESVDALFDNGRRGRAITNSANKRPLKSLSDMLKGKQGRFRQNLLGKRVDYSGRSVIIVGPELKLHQCGLPKKMALELFKPFVYSKLELYGMATTIKAAKRMVENERSEVWDILEEVIREHPVLLNRAPTLHRLGVQAFEPVLVEGKAIQLHPLVCAAFNADFDGDQMAVHVPLSLESQLEARVLMMSTNNILSPANGKPIIVPSKDIVLGIYYLTMELPNEIGENMTFSNIEELRHALDVKVVSLHAKVKCRYKTVDENNHSITILVNTTVGRMLLSEILPRHPKIPFLLINQLLTQKDIQNVIDIVYRHCGQKETVIFADRIMNLGYIYAGRSGISFGKDDLIVPSSKKMMINKIWGRVKEYEQQYQDGLITQGEKHNKVVDIWSKCTDDVAAAMMQGISTTKPGAPVNSVYIITHSGARGSATQMKQLAGMRGLMTKPSGEIIETPIISNFKEGLTVLEYFNSTHGSRKGLADTALKTANSGYLTRRLVDVSQDAIIVDDDCGTTNGITLTPVVDGGEVIDTLGERILGRTALHSVINPITGENICDAGYLIDEVMVEIIEGNSIESVSVRSALTCESKIGICATCYGRDLSRGIKINVGEAVGIIAAQSIGEPGTQLTMRTFHIGGAAQRSVVQSTIESASDVKVKLQNCTTVTNSIGQTVVMSRNCEMILIDASGREKAHHRVPYGARLLVNDDSVVVKGTKLVEWDPFTLPILTESNGIVNYLDLIDGLSIRKVIDETTGIASKVVIDWKQQSRSALLRPQIAVINDKNSKMIYNKKTKADSSVNSYFMSVDAILSVEDGQSVNAGDVLANIPRESSKTRDITGGLPRVAELFEARKPRDHAIISNIDGRVELGKEYKSKRRILIVPENGDNKVEYLISKSKHISVQDGDYVRRGDMLMDGNPVLQDILDALGIEVLANYLINEIQNVYRMQGVKINDKHIEVIVRQMLQKVEIIDSGDTIFVIGEQINRHNFEDENKKMIKMHKRPASGKPILQGITKASLQTDSFISAASFQETTRVLTEAAVSSRIDNLVGLKENVIVGNLIPAGTGAMVNRMKYIARKCDRKQQINVDNES
ncbi:MAG: DNA-directed RNA polymerase subunit beta' [Rhodospirillaceae bacterium]|jgi:DNA-directed RNA polymerase subunit beta'|nr:DNA-directed RNA polymerase subunit beta' [Rhodospirillaceae bacterium]